MALEPMVRTASNGGAIPLEHPTPDLHSPQDGFATHVERLEFHAERMSSSGSDIGEEIRRLQHDEPPKPHSRKSSLRSFVAAANDVPGTFSGSRSRNPSVSSYSNSIVDVNSAARWGGYSPSAYVTSPKGSIQSTHPSMQRQRSVTGSLLSTQEGVISEEAEASASAHNTPHVAASTQAAPHARNVSNFTLEYDRIVQDLEHELTNIHSHESAPAAGAHDQVAYGMVDPHDLPYRPGTADTFQQAQTAFHDFDGVHCVQPLADLHEVSEGHEHSMLHSVPHPGQEGAPPPQDGMVYYPAPVPRLLNLPKRLSQLPTAAMQSRRKSQALEAEARNSAIWVGGAGEGSSKADKKKAAEARRSMMSLPPQLRASMFFESPSAPHDVQVQGDSAEQALDGILEASANAPVNAFTDHPVAGHLGNEVYGKENKRKSTSALLELEKKKSQSELADKRKSTSTLLVDSATSAPPPRLDLDEPPSEQQLKKKEHKKNRSSFTLIFGRKSSSDQLKKLKKKNSSGDKLNKLQKRSSQLSLGNQLDDTTPATTEQEQQKKIQHLRQASASTNDSHIDESTPLQDDDIPADAHRGPGHEDSDEEEESDDGATAQQEEFFGPPTTLLAELQMRKAQQRTRNRTAVSAFPDGMHSTLLQLDAVAEIEKKRRQGQRVNLAWEDPNAADDDDDDVPLGMLFPGQNGLVQRAAQGNGALGMGGGGREDYNRPLGLLEKKALEDNEPLSSRRNRLRGLAPGTVLPRDISPGRQVDGDSAETPRVAVTASSDRAVPLPEPEYEDEPLAARKERLKRKEMLDSALGDMKSRPISGDFASEMMNQFATAPKEGDEKAGGETDGKTTTTPGGLKTPGGMPGEEEETLGQRRARLQAERGAVPTTPSGLAPNDPLRPPLKASRSLADILSAHPVANQARKVSNDQLLAALPRGSLLATNEVAAQRRSRAILEGNKRSTSYGGVFGGAGAGAGGSGGSGSGSGVGGGLGLGGPLVDVGAQNRTRSMLLDSGGSGARSGERGLLGLGGARLQPAPGALGGMQQAQPPNAGRAMTMQAVGPPPLSPLGMGVGGGLPMQQMGMGGMMAQGGGGLLSPGLPSPMGMPMGMGGVGMMQQPPMSPMGMGMGMPMQQQMSPMGMNMNMNMGMGMGMGMGMPMGGMGMGMQTGMPMQGMQMQGMPMQGMPMQGMSGVGGGVAQQASLEQGRRDAIDRWRQSVS